MPHINNECRKLIPQIEFSAGFDNGGPGCFDLSEFYGRDFSPIDCNKFIADALTECFKKPSFDLIAESVADVLNDKSLRTDPTINLRIPDCFIGDIYFMKTVGSEIHFRFYIADEREIDWLQEALESNIEPNKRLGQFWIVSKEQLNTKEMRSYFSWFCGAIVDMDTLSIWRIKPPPLA